MSHKMRLRPYNNQITGHDCLLTTEDNSSICKIRNSKELQFYLSMDKILQPFTPEFRGTVEVTVVGDREGKCKFEADFDGRFEVNASRNETGDEPLENYRGLDPKNLGDKTEFQDNAFTKDKLKHKVPPVLNDVGRNPWVERVHRFGRHTTYAEDTIPYIVLENICKGFKKPCIIDLKMGTEVYAGDWPARKLRNHFAKIRLTTTSTLGIRLSGMQVYQNGSFLCRDKFYGRGLSSLGLKNDIKLFFSSDHGVRTKILKVVIDKVQQIKSVVSTLDGYRLFGSSIVVFYEAEESADPNNLSYPRVEVKVVDFAHCRIFPCSNSESPKGPDDGFVFGVTKLIEIMQNITMNGS